MPHTSVALLRAGSSTAHHATAAAGWETSLAVVVLVMVVLAGARLASLRMPPNPGSDDDTDSGPGHGGPDGRPPPGPRQPEGEPGWWPEFERQFAAHVASRGTRVPTRHVGQRTSRAAASSACGLSVCGSVPGDTSAGLWLRPSSRLFTLMV